MMPNEPGREEQKRSAAVRYIREKVDQLLTVMGTLPLRPEELDDATLLEVDPIGIIADSFAQVVGHLNETNHELKVAKSEIRAILDSMGAAVIVLKPDGMIEDCNRQALEWFFCDNSYERVIGDSLSSACICNSGVESKLLAAEEREQEFEIGGRHYQVIATDICSEGGLREKIVFLYFDITRQKETEANLDLYAKTFNHTAEGILITDRDNRIVEVNEAFCKVMGYSEEELIGRSPKTFNSGLHDNYFYRDMWRSINERGHWQGEIFDRTKEGRIIPLLQTISEIRDGSGELTHRISVITDITSLKETQSRLDFLAHHDALTELPNRLLFNDRLNQAIERAKRHGTQLAVLFIDLDRFKTINDSLGHHVGDRFLLEVAQRLSDLVRKSDTVARLGGDEFVILAERLQTKADAERMADKIVNALKQPFTIDERTLHIGCSIGITLYPEDGHDAVSLLMNADAAMYQVKESGRDGYFKFCQELSKAAYEKLTLENELRLAIDRDELQLYYQPIIDLQHQRIVGAEALLRWPRGDGRFESPERFIPVAEETKLIVPIGERVIERSLEQLSRWPDLPLEYLSINASGSQVYTPGFADHLFAILREQGLDGDRVQVELTENILMRDVRSCNEVLHRLRERGIRIAIDDFGTGYSSLAYLKQLPIDTLKLDRSFVRDVPDDANDCAISRAVIGLGATLGLSTVAEGIETESQEAFMTEIGCQTVQGFLYSKALPAEAFERFVRGFQARPVARAW